MITRGPASTLTVANRLPAHMGRTKVVPSTMPLMSDTIPAPRRAARRGRRSFPSAVAVATTSSTLFCFTTSAMAAVYASAT